MDEDIIYLDNKERVKQELERLDEKKTNVKLNMERTIETQDSLVSLIQKIYNEDPSVENDDKFAECYEKIKSKANFIQGACIEEYNKVCKEYETMEEEWYLLENAEIEDDFIEEKEEKLEDIENNDEDEERHIWIRG